MTDLFLDPKVVNYQEDKYQLILLTMRWARALKAKGSPEPMQALIERALREIVEKKITKEEIMANKLVSETAAAEEVPAVVSVAEPGPSPEAKAALQALKDEEAGAGKKKAKKKAKK